MCFHHYSGNYFSSFFSDKRDSVRKQALIHEIFIIHCDKIKMCDSVPSQAVYHLWVSMIIVVFVGSSKAVSARCYLTRTVLALTMRISYEGTIQDDGGKGA